jgi:hypothetical protein
MLSFVNGVLWLPSAFMIQTFELPCGLLLPFGASVEVKSIVLPSDDQSVGVFIAFPPLVSYVNPDPSGCAVQMSFPEVNTSVVPSLDQ